MVACPPDLSGYILCRNMEREVYMVHRESARGGVEASAHARRAMRELARAVENGWAPHAQFSQKPESCNGVRESEQL